MHWPASSAAPNPDICDSSDAPSSMLSMKVLGKSWPVMFFSKRVMYMDVAENRSRRCRNRRPSGSPSLSSRSGLSSRNRSMVGAAKDGILRCNSGCTTSGTKRRALVCAVCERDPSSLRRLEDFMRISCGADGAVFADNTAADERGPRPQADAIPQHPCGRRCNLNNHI